MRHPALLVALADLRSLVRSPLTWLTVLVLPLVLGPGMLWSVGRLEKSEDRARNLTEYTVAAPAEFERWLEEDDHLAVVPVGELVGPDKVDAVVALPNDDQPATVRYLGESRRGQSAMRRARTVLRREQRLDRRRRFDSLGLDIEREEVVGVQEVDLSTPEQRAGLQVGGLLPLSLILLMAAGGLGAAMDVITGEKERGTLEALLTTRLDRRAVIAGKALVVLVFAVLACVVAALALAVVVAMGWMPGEGAAQLGRLSLGPVQAGLLLLLLGPLLIQVVAVLVGVATAMPSYRAGSVIGGPVLLVLMAPAGLASLPMVELSPLLAMVPIANASLAVRDLMAGQARLGLTAVVIGASFAWTGAALVVAARVVGSETALFGSMEGRERRERGNLVPEAVGLWVAVGLLLLFFGSMAQTAELVSGMALTQLVVIALPAVLAVVALSQPLRQTLSLRAPRTLDLGLAMGAGVLLPGIGTVVATLQDPLVPTPSSLSETMGAALDPGTHPWVVLLTFAVLPGICEELLFRGALAGLLRRSLGPVGLCLLVGAMFGAFHLALPRMLPTAALGIVLTWAGLRSGSIAVPMLMHMLNNATAIVVFSQRPDLAADPGAGLVVLAAAGGLLAVGLVAAMGRGGSVPRGGVIDSRVPTG